MRLALLGDPVEHSLSPKMHTAALVAMGIAGSYEAIRVSGEEFEGCVAQLSVSGFVGANVTIPHKGRAARIGKTDDDIVLRVGAANCLKFDSGNVYCRNTDAPGFLAHIQGFPCGNALLLGAGGAGATVAYALLSIGWRVTIWNRSRSRAEELAARIGCNAIEKPDPAGCALIVNSTPVGLKPGEMPEIIWDNVDENAVFYDVAYREEPTDFLKRAAKIGCRTIDGREMLVEQGALSLEWWTGRIAPREVMRSAIGL